MNLVLSILDLAPIARGQAPSESLSASVELARAAERSGYLRVWYAEHHNMPRIASSATSVLIAHVAAHTSTIRLGAGGIMLPNHAPLTIAEQFGTLASLHPGRIDLGLGRAPGSDQNTMYALRRDPASADAFPQDVLELQAFLGDETRVPGRVRDTGAGHPRAALHPRILTLRCPAGRGVRAPLCVRVALRPGRARGRGVDVPPRVQAVRPARRAVRHRRRQRDRRRRRLRRPGTAAHDAVGPRPRLPRARPGLVRRAGRTGSRVTPGRAGRPDDDVHRGRDPRRHRRLSRGLREACRRRRAHHRPPVAHDRGPAPVGLVAGRVRPGSADVRRPVVRRSAPALGGYG